ncbi:MAG TPA: zeta toxin family protein [Capsulimonadaceae bacterium]|jgi:predicted ABC-type ATPase
MTVTPPQFILIAGPNGAGKSTTATHLLPKGVHYINADEIALTLPEDANGNDIAAGRLFFAEWTRLERARRDFAVETTLANKSLVGRLKRLKIAGYQIRMIFLRLPSVDLAIERVAARVRAGGHNIPRETIRRRYTAGIKNLVHIYVPSCDLWTIYENTQPSLPKLVAEGGINLKSSILDSSVWEQINATAYGQRT